MTLNLSKRVRRVLECMAVRVSENGLVNVLMPLAKDYSVQLQDQTQIEIRCVKLDHRGPKILGENTFPDSCHIKINGNKTF